MEKPIIHDPVEYLSKITDIIYNDDITNYIDTSIIFTPPLFLWNPKIQRHAYFSPSLLRSTLEYFEFNKDLRADMKAAMEGFYVNMEDLISNSFTLPNIVQNEVKNGKKGNRRYLKESTSRYNELLTPIKYHLHKKTVNNFTHIPSKKTETIKIPKNQNIHLEKEINNYLHTLFGMEAKYIKNIIKKQKKLEDRLDNGLYEKILDNATIAYRHFDQNNNTDDCHILAEILTNAIINDKSIRLFTMDSDFHFMCKLMNKTSDPGSESLQVISLGKNLHEPSFNHKTSLNFCNLN